uniref:Uncharacterized protein n=1 Tax=Picea sitchensis TaxID=3332 RepID=D5ABR0_PICSI|nr:unknown [Picea sitchensis]
MGMGNDNGGNGGGGESLQKKIEDQWQRSAKHAETYPYVWGSYAVVWGGLGVYTIYKWRKLRRMEDRVRTLQQKLKHLVDAEEAAKIQEAEAAAFKKKTDIEATGK